MSDITALVADNLEIWTGAIERKSGAGRGGGKRINLYGIERLRALILDLAVLGKLVPQDPADEPATKALERLAKARAAKIKAGLARKPKSIATLPAHLRSLPSGWVWTQLGTIAEISPSNVAGDDTEVSFVPMAMVSTSISGEHEAEIRRWGEIKKGFTHFADGDLGLAKITPCFENGKAAIFHNLRNGIGAGTTELHIARPWSDDVNRRYILLTMKTGSFLANGEKQMTGTAGQKRVTRAYFEATPLPFPPLAEQRRIVAKVDELMALCDALERESADALTAHQTLVEALLTTLVSSADAADLAANWARLESNFDTLFTTEASIDAIKQTILDLAVRGKLVEQDARDQAASELLKQTAKGKADLIRQGLAKRDKALPRVDHSSVPFKLPSGWTWARFPELGIFERGKSKHRPRNDPKLFSPGIYPLIQTGEVARATGLITEVHSYYSEVGLAQSKLWKEGTLCITIAANIADAAIMGFDACFPDSVVGFVPAKPISDPSYFLYFIRTAKADLLRFAPSTAQKNINLGILETLVIPLPPLAEQRRIVAKVDALMALCDALKIRLADAAQTQRRLADAVVERAAA